MRMCMMVGGVALGLLLGSVSASPAALAAQVDGPGPNGRWPLQPRAPGNRTLAPFMEGWYENEDGTYSISFGYLNANRDTLEIPLGTVKSRLHTAVAAFAKAWKASMVREGRATS